MTKLAYSCEEENTIILRVIYSITASQPPIVIQFICTISIFSSLLMNIMDVSNSKYHFIENKLESFYF